MSKTLYISDLDGTLLNSQKQLSASTIESLNELIRQEVKFSIATARTPATVEPLLNEVQLKEPVVLMNGAVLYDLQEHKYLDVEYINSHAVKEVLAQLGDLISEGFIYSIHNNLLRVYYDNLEYKERREFYEERKNSSYKQFLAKPLKTYEQVVYFVFIDDEANIESIYNKLKTITDLALVMYKDIYSEEAYILEVYSHKGTKANGVAKLRKKGAYDKVICFGDNLNDLSMFTVSEEAYAVENALEEVKRRATAVIGTNDEEGVVSFIKEHYKKENDKKE